MTEVINRMYRLPYVYGYAIRLAIEEKIKYGEKIIKMGINHVELY